MEGQNLSIFSELANANRLEILYTLDKTPLKISMLAKKLNASIQAIQRHINRLASSGLIEKDADGTIQITAVGQGALLQVPTFLFLSKHKKYFQTHTFSGIPKKLIQRIGDLYNCEFIEDPVQAWQRAKDQVTISTEFFCGLTSVIPIEFYPIAKKMLEKGMRYKIIYSENTSVAKGFAKARKEYGWLDALKEGLAEERYVKRLSFTVTANEKASQLHFANKKTDDIDAGSMFYSEDERFRNWCLELFYHYWNDVEKVSQPILKEI